MRHHLHPLMCNACCTAPCAVSSAASSAPIASSLLVSSGDVTAPLHLIHKVQTNTYKSNWIPEGSVQLGRTQIHIMRSFRVKNSCTDTWHQSCHHCKRCDMTYDVRFALKHSVHECESNEDTRRVEKIRYRTEVFPNQRSAQRDLGFRDTSRNLHIHFVKCREKFEIFCFNLVPTNMHAYINIYTYAFVTSCYTNIRYT
jgi:hypothetical protein